MHDEYLGAFIFGSVACDNSNEYSDLDVKVVVKDDNPCPNINHPIVGGVKLDITFTSQEQLAEMTAKQMQSDRPPFIFKSIILFDKTGHLNQLKETCLKKTPPRYEEKDHQYIQFIIFNANSKVERNLEKDPASSLLSMTMGLNDLLKTHYKLNGRQWLSDKFLLGDLAAWDKEANKLVCAFLRANEVEEKFNAWTNIIRHVLKPLGGKKKIQEINCSCENCAKDLEALLS